MRDKKRIDIKETRAGSRSPDLSVRQRNDSGGPTSHARDPVAFFQRYAGNNLVQRLSSACDIQAKPESGSSNHICEAEADRMAERVMRMPSGGRFETDDNDGSSLIKKNQGKSQPADSDVEADNNIVKSGGQSMPASARLFFESRFGYDFDKVRISADLNASAAARAVNARAFTKGNNIVFGAGQYDPDSTDGRKLLAHELTHVLQQRKHNSALIQRYTMDCTKEKNPKFDPESIKKAAKYVLDVISSPDRPKHCLTEPEFQQGVVKILEDSTLICSNDLDEIAEGGVLTKNIYLGPRSMTVSSKRLSGIILHEALHIWEGSFGHGGIVGPCTKACIPESSQPTIDTNPEHCKMPPQKSELSFGLLFEGTRGTGMAAVLSYRYKLFSALKSSLSVQLGVDLSYEHLFKPDLKLQPASELFQAGLMAGLKYGPSLLDRKGFLVSFETGPSMEVSKGWFKPGINFNLGFGYDFTYFSIGGKFGAVVPLTDSAQWILNFMLMFQKSF